MVNLGFRSVSMPIQRFPHGARERVYSPNHGRMVHSVSVAGVTISGLNDLILDSPFAILLSRFRARPKNFRELNKNHVIAAASESVSESSHRLFLILENSSIQLYDLLLCAAVNFVLGSNSNFDFLSSLFSTS